MARRSIVRAAVGESLRHGWLWLVQFCANPILFALFAVWLLIPAASAWYIVLNVFVALVIVVSVMVLHGGTLNYFLYANGDSTARLKPAFLRALRHVIAIAICVGVFYLLWIAMDRIDAYQDSVPAYLRSEMPAALRRHVTLAFLTSAFEWIAFALRYIVIPGLLLPFALATSDLGFRGFLRAGFRGWMRAVSSLKYWIVLVVAALVGIVATQAIFGWMPDFTKSTFRFETFSLSARVIFAYVLAIWAWMLACAVVARASGEADVRGDH